MERWSILSDNIVYVRSVGNDIMNGIDIKMVDYRDHKNCKVEWVRKKEKG